MKKKHIIVGVFFCSKSVDLPADGIESRGQLGRCAGLCALEQHMLQKVGDAAQRLRLVAGAAFHPDADGAGAHRGHLFRQDAHAVWQYGFLYHGL